MEGWLWALVCIMAMITIALLVKICILRKAAREMANAFADKLTTDTNTLIDISCNDRYMRKLANAINKELRKLRTERCRFQQGDFELKMQLLMFHMIYVRRLRLSAVTWNC